MGARGWALCKRRGSKGLRGARRGRGGLRTEMRLSALSEVGWAGQTLCVSVCVCVCVCVCTPVHTVPGRAQLAEAAGRPRLAFGTSLTQPCDCSVGPPERPCPPPEGPARRRPHPGFLLTLEEEETAALASLGTGGCSSLCLWNFLLSSSTLKILKWQYK